eukprot:6048402-Pyramimonas_sp.AAC.1
MYCYQPSPIVTGCYRYMESEGHLALACRYRPRVGGPPGARLPIRRTEGAPTWCSLADTDR